MLLRFTTNAKITTAAVSTTC